MKIIPKDLPLIFLVCLFILTPTITLGQNKGDINKCKGQIALHNGDTIAAINHLSKAITCENMEPYSRVIILPLLTSPELHLQAIHYSEELILIGYPSQQISKLASQQLKQSKEWAKFITRLPELEKKYKNSIDTIWVSILDSLLEADQAVRTGNYSFFDNPDSIMSQEDPMNFIDSLNFQALLLVTKQRGFPSSKKVGYIGVNNAFILLWHHRGSEYKTNPLWTDIKPHINKEIANGNLSKGFYAMFEDHYAVYNNKPMLYGSLYAYYRNSETFDDLEVIDPLNLDKRRAQIGFAPIQLWLEANQIPIPRFLKETKTGVIPK